MSMDRFIKNVIRVTPRRNATIFDRYRRDSSRGCLLGEGVCPGEVRDMAMVSCGICGEDNHENSYDQWLLLRREQLFLVSDLVRSLSENSYENNDC